MAKLADIVHAIQQARYRHRSHEANHYPTRRYLSEAKIVPTWCYSIRDRVNFERRIAGTTLRENFYGSDPSDARQPDVEERAAGMT